MIKPGRWAMASDHPPGTWAARKPGCTPLAPLQAHRKWKMDVTTFTIWWLIPFLKWPARGRHPSSKGILITIIIINDCFINMCIYIYISADPGLRQGRGGAWDHRRCGTCFVTAMALTLSKVVPATIACLCLNGLPSLKGLKRAAAAPTTKPSCRPFQGNSRSYTPQPSVFKGGWNLLCHGHGPRIVQGRSSSNCLSVFKRSAKLQRPQTRRGSSHDTTFPQAFPRQLSQPHAPAICF